MSLSFDKRLTEIVEDNQSGSRAITLRVCSLFRQLISLKDIDRSEIINRLRSACRKLEKAHPSLTSLQSLSESVLLIVDTAPPKEELIKRLNRIIDEWGELFVERTTLQLASHLIQRLEDVDTILLHSNSSTIHNVFRHISTKNKNIKFIQTVSWPIKEGINMARSMASLGYRIELISDAGMATALKKVDLVLLGADSIDKTSFINKQGSLAICQLAQLNEVPVLLIADSSKLVRKGENKEVLQQNPYELMEEETQNVMVKNYYFENVPLSMVTGVLLQHGAYTPEGLVRLLEDPRRKKREQMSPDGLEDSCIDEPEINE